MPGGVEETADAGGATVAIERSGEARLAGNSTRRGVKREDADQKDDRRVAEVVLDFLNAPCGETALDLFVPEVEGREVRAGKVEEAGADEASEEGNHQGI